MCGRYSLATTENLAERFDAQQTELTLLPRYNVAPSQSMPTVVRDGEQRLVEMRWGLIPSWSKEAHVSFSTINARAETVTTSPAFRGPFKRRRCLVPASGFYEWRRIAQGKQPYCIRLRGGEPFAFAGLYDIWRGADGSELYSYTIITTTPNELVAPIHNRMPAILRRADEAAWLAEDADPARLLSLLAPYPAERMETFAVSRALNNPMHDDPMLARPLAAA